VAATLFRESLSIYAEFYSCPYCDRKSRDQPFSADLDVDVALSQPIGAVLAVTSSSPPAHDQKGEARRGAKRL